MISLLQLFLGAFAALAGASQSSSALSSVVASENVISSTSSLIVQPSASGAIPKFHPSMSAPNIAVGRGGAGAKDQPYRPQAKNDKSINEEVRKTAAGDESAEKNAGSQKPIDGEDTQQQGTLLRGRRDDEPPNPKKRMWEENIDSLAQETDRVRDEL